MRYVLYVIYVMALPFDHLHSKIDEWLAGCIIASLKVKFWYVTTTLLCVQT